MIHPTHASCVRIRASLGFGSAKRFMPSLGLLLLPTIPLRMPGRHNFQQGGNQGLKGGVPFEAGLRFQEPTMTFIKYACAIVLASGVCTQVLAAQDAGSGPTAGATSKNDAGGGPTQGAKTNGGSQPPTVSPNARDAGSGPTTGSTSANDAGSGPTQ